MNHMDIVRAEHDCCKALRVTIIQVGRGRCQRSRRPDGPWSAAAMGY